MDVSHWLIKISTITGISDAMVMAPLVLRWLKTGPSDPDNSETESSSDNGETGSTSHRL